jgi:hypothetical protein
MGRGRVRPVGAARLCPWGPQCGRHFSGGRRLATGNMVCVPVIRRECLQSPRQFEARHFVLRRARWARAVFLERAEGGNTKTTAV